MLFRQACSRIPEGVICLELGPHALMRTPLRQNRHAPPFVCRCAMNRSFDPVVRAGRPDLQHVATMRKGEDAEETVRMATADLWLKGARVTWQVPPKAASAHTGE